ncbi:MAG: porin family protein [Sphingobacteriales bacterium]|nr:porin family protein [Sphingobacteriales bacterium]MBI3720778.1 porin family protein [Sphingobacteriales bacterium]
MKTKLFLIAAMLIITSASFAQGLKFGIKAGANIGKIDGKSFKEEFKYGYHLGGFAEIKLSKKLSLQPEVLWNQVNADTSSEFSKIYQVSNLNNVKLGYLSIPILLDYKIANILTLQAGPQFGILIDKSRTTLQNGGDAFKKGDFSVLAGAQVNLASFRIYGRYNIGLSNINDIDNKDKWKSQGFQVGVGIAL